MIAYIWSGIKRRTKELINKKRFFRNLLLRMIQLDTSKHFKHVNRQAHLEENRFKNFADLVAGIENEKSSLLGNSSLFQIFLLLPLVPKGDFVEIGTYHGGGAVFIKRALSLLGKDDNVVAFDTFGGHPHVAVGVDASHKVGDFPVDANLVKDYLYKNKVEVVEGDIMDTLSLGLSNRKVSFIHLDVDLYEPTKFVLNEMNNFLEPLGVVVIDDYLKESCPGIERAVQEFVGKNNSSFYLFPRPENNQAVILRIR
jgi:SAM-dependent methyltransferase